MKHGRSGVTAAAVCGHGMISIAVHELLLFLRTAGGMYCDQFVLMVTCDGLMDSGGWRAEWVG